MNKAIVVLTGDPEAKNDFIERVKSLAWINNFNPKSYLGRVTDHLREGNEKNEDYWNFLAEVMKLANKYFNYEEESVREKIAKFLSDEDEVKRTDGSSFDSFILIIHGLSVRVRDSLKDEFPLYVIRLATSKQPSNETSQDFVLETDSDDYDSEVVRVVNGLTKNT